MQNTKINDRTTWVIVAIKMTSLILLCGYGLSSNAATCDATLVIANGNCYAAWEQQVNAASNIYVTAHAATMTAMTNKMALDKATMNAAKAICGAAFATNTVNIRTNYQKAMDKAEVDTVATKADCIATLIDSVEIARCMCDADAAKAKDEANANAEEARDSSAATSQKQRCELDADSALEKADYETAAIQTSDATEAEAIQDRESTKADWNYLKCMYTADGARSKCNYALYYPCHGLCLSDLTDDLVARYSDWSDSCRDANATRMYGNKHAVSAQLLADWNAYGAMTKAWKDARDNYDANEAGYQRGKTNSETRADTDRVLRYARRRCQYPAIPEDAAQLMDYNAQATTAESEWAMETAGANEDLQTNQSANLNGTGGVGGKTRIQQTVVDTYNATVATDLSNCTAACTAQLDACNAAVALAEAQKQIDWDAAYQALVDCYDFLSCFGT